MTEIVFNPIQVESPATELTIVVDDLIKQITHTLPTEGITPGNVAQLVLQLMQLVERVPSLSGAQKKQIVIQVVNRLLQQFNVSSEVQSLISMTVPPLIDAFIQVDKKQVMISIEKGIGRFFSCIKNGCRCD